MGGKSGGGGSTPDPVATAEAQARFNKEAVRESARMNQIGQITPFGSTYWTGELGDPSRTQHTALHPALSRIFFGMDSPNYGYVPPAGTGAGAPGRAEGMYSGRALLQPDRGDPIYWGEENDGITRFDELRFNQDIKDFQRAQQQQGAQTPSPVVDVGVRGPAAMPQWTGGGLFGQILGATQNPLDFSGLQAVDAGPAPTYDFGNERASMEKAIYDRAYNLLAPELQRQEEGVRTDLANRGLDPFSEAYTGLYDQFADRRARSLSDLSLASVLGGAQEHERLANLAARTRQAQFAREMGARQQGISEMVMQRQQPIQDLISLLSMTAPGGLPAMPDVASYAVQAPDYMGMVGSNYAADQARQAATTGGMFGLLGGLGQAAITKWSDRRLKQDIKAVGKLDNGLTVHLFRYKSGGPFQLGLMADEVEKVKPDAAGSWGGGFMYVDYEKAVQ